MDKLNMYGLGNEIRTNPDVATTRAYLMYCSCEIENYSQKVIIKMVNKNCSHMYDFFNNKQLLGELNFKWKDECFDKFLKLFGQEFYNNSIKELKDKKIENINNHFETLKANRGSVAHDNHNTNATIKDIDDSFQNCKQAFLVIINYIDNTMFKD